MTHLHIINSILSAYRGSRIVFASSTEDHVTVFIEDAVYHIDDNIKVSERRNGNLLNTNKAKQVERKLRHR